MNQDNPNSTDPHRHPWLGAGLMYGSVLFFATSVLVLRGLGETVDPWMAGAFRFLAGFIVCCLMYGPGGHLRMERLFAHRGLILRGVLGSAGVLLFYASLPSLGAGKAGFLATMYVPFAAAGAWLCLGESMNGRMLVCIAGSMVGMYLLSGLAGVGWNASPAVWMGMGSALCSAAAVVLIRSLSRSQHGSTIFAAQCVYGFLLCLIPLSAGDSKLTAPTGIAYLIAAVTSAGGQLMMTFGYRHVSVSTGSLMGMATPVCILLGGMALFGERFTPLEWMGTGLILASCALMTRRAASPGEGPPSVATPSPAPLLPERQAVAGRDLTSRSAQEMKELSCPS